jgi:poly(A) polymerase Pap1
MACRINGKRHAHGFATFSPQVQTFHQAKVNSTKHWRQDKAIAAGTYTH